MAAPVKNNFKMYQGSTFSEVIRWESSTKVFKSITDITKAAPTVVTAIAHGIPVGWRALITDVGGMKEINSSTEYVYITNSTTDTVTLGEVNAASYTAYTTGGVISYNAPTSLVGYTARMQIRATIDATDFLFELTTENGGIVLDTNLQTITLLISATTTATATFSSAVYSLEMVKSGVVTTIMTGNVSLVKEVTR
jgi:hypothetical protein